MNKQNIFFGGAITLILIFILILIFGGLPFWPSLLSQYRFLFLVLLLLFLPYILPYLFKKEIRKIASFPPLSSVTENKLFLFISIFYLAIFIKSTLFAYWSFEVAGIDFSVLDQMIPYTALGKFMFHPVLEVNHFGIHSTPIYFLLYPLHRLFNSPYFFLLLHPIILWSAVFPLRGLLQYFWSGENYAVQRILFILCYFNFYQLAQVLRYNFHFEVFYLPFFLYLFLFIQKGKNISALITTILILSVKEDAGIYLFCVAMAYFLVSKKKWLALIIGSLSLSVFLINGQWVLPHFRESDIEIVAMINKYGKSYSQIIINFILHPFDVFIDVIRGGWLKILIPLLFLPLLSPFFFISMSGLILITSTSSYLDIRTLAIHYSLPYLPFIFFGTIQVLSQNRLLSQYRERVVLLITILSLTVGGGFLKFSPLNFKEIADFSEISKIIEQGQEKKAENICIQGYLMPHFSYENLLQKKFLTDRCFQNRERYYLFNTKINSYPHNQQEILAMIQTLKNEGYHQIERGNFLLLTSHSLF